MAIDRAVIDPQNQVWGWHVIRHMDVDLSIPEVRCSVDSWRTQADEIDHDVQPLRRWQYVWDKYQIDQLDTADKPNRQTNLRWAQRMLRQVPVWPLDKDWPGYPPPVYSPDPPPTPPVT